VPYFADVIDSHEHPVYGRRAQAGEVDPGPDPTIPSFDASAYIHLDPNTKRVVQSAAQAYADAKSDSERSKAFLIGCTAILGTVCPPCGVVAAVVVGYLLANPPPPSNGQITWESSVGPNTAQPGTFEDFAYQAMHATWLAQEQLVNQGKQQGTDIPYLQDSVVAAFSAAVQVWNATHAPPRRWIERSLSGWGTDAIKYVFSVIRKPGDPTRAGVWINDGARVTASSLGAQTGTQGGGVFQRGGIANPFQVHGLGARVSPQQASTDYCALAEVMRKAGRVAEYNTLIAKCNAQRQTGGGVTGSNTGTAGNLFLIGLAALAAFLVYKQVKS
jgi:hypothetical protein